MEKQIAVLGSTGSVGTQSLEVCRSQGYRVKALAAHRNIRLLEEQAREFLPELVAVVDEAAAAALRDSLRDTRVRVVAGIEGVCEAAALPGVDYVLNSVVGIAGLRPTIAALRAGKRLALANKESLVAGGELVMGLARQNGSPILPVDSEHSAIFQSLRAGRPSEIRKILLTASGGPFYGRSRAELEGITPEQALRHPNWEMGAKITIDSATLMNKGLELIEAVRLFEVRPDQVEILVHRQSVIHSAVEFCDGAVIAQLGVPDMKLPIQYALTHPERMPDAAPGLSLTEYGTLTFAPPDEETFRCLRAARRAVELGGLYPCLINGANEEAVGLFLERKIPFLRIGELVEGILEQFQLPAEYSFETVFETDRMAREYVLAHC